MDLDTLLKAEMDAAMARLQGQVARQVFAVPPGPPYVPPRRTLRDRLRSVLGRFADAFRGARAGWRGETIDCACDREGGW